MIRIFLPAFVLAMIFSAGEATQAQDVSWELSGQVLRADTGTPVSGASVRYRGVGDVEDSTGRTLNPPTLKGETTTDTDGTYLITGLPSGGYRIRAVAPGFLAAATMGGSRPHGWKRCPGEPAPNNDLKLRQDTIHLTTMNTEALVRSHGKGLLPFENAVFSPDGKELALTLDWGGIQGQKQELWIYDLPTTLAKQVAYPLEGAFYVGWLIWQGDQLYMHAAWTLPGRQPAQIFAAASISNAPLKVIPALPPDAEAAYTAVGNANDNARFHVEGESSCEIEMVPHCGQGMVVVVEDKTTRKRQILSVAQSPNFLFFFDPKSSVLVYASGEETAFGWVHGVTAFDLTTGRKRFTELPGDNILNPLTVQAVQDGYLMAYRTEGDCNPADTDEPQHLTQLGIWPPKMSVCFATIGSPEAGPSSSGPN